MQGVIITGMPGVGKTRLSTELYDLATDPGETNDLAELEPERAQRLDQARRVWTRRFARPAGSADPGRPGSRPGTGWGRLDRSSP